MYVVCRGRRRPTGPAGRSSCQSLSLVSNVSVASSLGWCSLLAMALKFVDTFLCPPVECGWVWGSGRSLGWLALGGSVGSGDSWALWHWSHNVPFIWPLPLLVGNPSPLAGLPLNLGAAGALARNPETGAEGPPSFP